MRPQASVRGVSPARVPPGQSLRLPSLAHSALSWADRSRRRLSFHGAQSASGTGAEVPELLTVQRQALHLGEKISL